MSALRRGAAVAAGAGVALWLRGRGDGDGDVAHPIHVHAAITVRRERADLYAFWRDVENFPRFMAHVAEVRSTGPGRTHWSVRGPLHTSVGWNAQITDDVAGERISWRSLDGAAIRTAGSVRFVDAPGDRGTEIHVELRYGAPGGTAGALLARLLGEEPRVQLGDDLRRLKQLVETGEIARSEGAPEGQLSRRLIRQRPAQPPRPRGLATTVGGAR